MKKTLSIVSVFLFTLMLLGQGVSAETISKDLKGSPELSKAEKEEIKENFSELGIDEKTQNKLLEKLANGQKLDSMKQVNIDKAMKQFDIKTLVEEGEKTFTFNDGSKIVIGSEYENPQKAVQPLANNYRTVTSYINWGVVNCSFKTDFVTRSGAYDYIQRSYNPSVSVPGGSYSNKKVEIIRKYENSNRRAKSTLSFDYETLYISSTGQLHFYVGNNSYETVWFD